MAASNPTQRHISPTSPSVTRCCSSGGFLGLNFPPFINTQDTGLGTPQCTVTSSLPTSTNTLEPNGVTLTGPRAGTSGLFSGLSPAHNRAQCWVLGRLSQAESQQPCPCPPAEGGLRQRARQNTRVLAAAFPGQNQVHTSVEINRPGFSFLQLTAQSPGVFTRLFIDLGKICLSYLRNYAQLPLNGAAWI